MKKLILSCFFQFLLIGIIQAAVDHNPLNNGGTLTHNALGHNFEGAIHNPALLGVERIPKAGLMFPGTMLGVGAWSDKLALSPFNRYFTDSTRETSALITKILDKSFKLKGLSADEVSDKLTKELADGVSIYLGYRHSLANLGWNRLAFDVSTHFDEEVKIPGGPFLTVFSRDKGLLAGNSLDFSEFRQQAVWATDFTFSFGLPVTIPALHEFFKLEQGAGGIGIKYVMGHSVLKATTESGHVYFDDAGNQVSVDGRVKIQTTGFGFSGPWRAADDNLFSSMFHEGLPVTGHGIGMDLGGILYDDKGTLTVNFSNIGVLLWMNNVQTVEYKIRKDDLDVYDIIHGIELADQNGGDPNTYIFNHEGEEISGSRDTLDTKGDVLLTWLPAALNIGYSYSWDFTRLRNQNLRLLADYAHAAVNYEQSLAPSPGRSFIPRLSFGGEAGVLHGFLPIRLGYVIGGAEHFASAVGAGLNFKYVSLNASYKAIGHPFFVPRRGMEVAVGLNVNWGMSADQDGDGIPDKTDMCRSEPEDKDGFDDEDGCPDYDNDKDGIPDTVDQCPLDPEDLDQFEDTDGCPDYDNDRDEVPDTLDKCIMEPEDRDNFNDDDGCPDFDNDGDNVPDSLDKCPNMPEDIDMFEDADGCPDFDNDKDGVPDTLDNCINDPETFNGYKDDDGCPDTLVRPSEKETKALNTKLQAINFKTGSAELLGTSYAALDYIVQFLKNFETLRYEIQGHTDSQGSDEYNLVLSAARAGSVTSYLISKGVPKDRVIAIGYGETMPVADNKTSRGRAKNRRVEFKIIETNDEYSTLRAREAEFKVKVQEAKIKGVQ
ncbi:MAG: OmpA family protein [Chitinispirillaceae bacterium]|nr:OmpA family protein [Chitinispirillaceae bacterium]